MESKGSKNWSSEKRDGVESLVNSVERLFGDEEYADLTIVAGQRTFRVHKAVICPRSGFFRAACKKGTFKEGRESIVKLTTNDEAEDGDEVDIIAMMISYMYHLDYEVHTTLREGDETVEDHLPQAAETDETATTHAKMFAVAEKYDIPGLKRAAWSKFTKYRMTHWLSAHDLAEAIRTVHSRILDPRSESCSWHGELSLEMLYASQETLAYDEVRDAMESIPGLAYELFLEQTKKCKAIKK